MSTADDAWKCYEQSEEFRSGKHWVWVDVLPVGAEVKATPIRQQARILATFRDGFIAGFKAAK